MTHLRENIEAGIALLDREGPEDWRARINLNTLDLKNVRLCVLGQAYGKPGDNWLMNGFDRGCGVLGLEDADRICEFGFEPLEVAEGIIPPNGAYESLTEMWKEYLSA